MVLLNFYSIFLRKRDGYFKIIFGMESNLDVCLPVASGLLLRRVIKSEIQF